MITFRPLGPVVVEDASLCSAIAEALPGHTVGGPGIPRARYLVAASRAMAASALNASVPFLLDIRPEPNRVWLEDTGLAGRAFASTDEVITLLRRELAGGAAADIGPPPPTDHPNSTLRYWLAELRTETEAEYERNAAAQQQFIRHIARLEQEMARLEQDIDAAIAQIEAREAAIRALEMTRAFRWQRRVSRALRRRHQPVEASGEGPPAAMSPPPSDSAHPAVETNADMGVPRVAWWLDPLASRSGSQAARRAAPPHVDLICVCEPEPSDIDGLPVRVHTCGSIQSAPPGKAEWVAFLDPRARVLREGLREALSLCGPDTDAVITPDMAANGRVAPRNGWSPTEGRFWPVTRGLCLIRRSMIDASGGLDPQDGWDAPGRILLCAREPRVVSSPTPGCRRDGPLAGADDAPAHRRPPAGSMDRAHTPHGRPRVSLIIPTRDQPHYLATLLDGIRRTAEPAHEVILVDNGTTDPRARRILGACGHRVVPSPGPFNFARLVNRGVAEACGDVIVLLNNDLEFRNRDWLTTLTEVLDDESVGVVGSLLAYPSGALQHAGLAVHDGQVIAPGRGLRMGELPPEIRAVPARRTAVVGAVLATPRSTFTHLNGFDTIFAGDYNDVDYCLRAGAHGAATMCAPVPGIIHHEGVSRGREAGSGVMTDWLFFRTRWQHVLDTPDPYWPRLARAPGKAGDEPTANSQLMQSR